MAESSETSPLLADVDRQEENEQDAVGPPTTETPSSATTYFRRPIKVLTIVLLVFAILALSVLVATAITIHFAPFMLWYWNATDALKPTGTWVIVALILSIINLFHMLPAFMNIPLDIILSIFIISWAVSLLTKGWPNGDWCGPDRGFGPDPQPTNDCGKWVLATKVLVGVGADFTFVVGLTHLVLLPLRIIALMKTKFWKRVSVSGFTFPTGKVRFGFTFEVLRQDPAMADAGSQPGSPSNLA